MSRFLTSKFSSVMSDLQDIANPRVDLFPNNTSMDDSAFEGLLVIRAASVYTSASSVR